VGCAAGIRDLHLRRVRGDRYGRRFTLTWSLFALNAILLLNFVLPGAIIDASARIVPGLFTSYTKCALVGAVAGATKFAGSATMDLLVGMDRAIVVQHALLESLAALLFGIAGGLCIPPVLRRLEARGAIEPSTGGK